MVLTFAQSRDAISISSSTTAIKKDRTGAAATSEESEQGKSKKKVYKTAPKWWVKPSIKYAFSHPHVRSRLEKLMGSNLVSLTDRDYMQNLQERILEHYAESMDKRIKAREEEEMERVKNLVLSGKIPICDAPESMAHHPIMLIESFCNQLIAERRAKIKVHEVRIPTHLYLDDTPDPPSGLSIENGHVFRAAGDKLCNPPQRFITERDMQEQIKIEIERENRFLQQYLYDEGAEEEEEEEEAELPQQKQAQKKEDAVDDEKVEGQEVEEEQAEFGVEDEYMFTKEEYERLRYESPLIRELKLCETVDKLYMLADEIIGGLKTIEDTRTVDDTTSTVTRISVGTTRSVTPSMKSRRSMKSQRSAKSQKSQPTEQPRDSE